MSVRVDNQSESYNYPPHGEYLCDPTDHNGCAPCKQLSEVEEKVRKTRIMLVDLERERQKLKEQINQHHDRLIHRLPPEIASEIFELCVPDNLDLFPTSTIRSRYTICAPLVLSDVCRRWRDIAHSTPQLWSILPLFSQVSNPRSLPGPLFVKEWINRAGQLPLSIFFYATSDKSTVDAAIQIIDILNQFSNRWLRLDYDGPSSLLLHFNIDDKDLPQLRSLRLYSQTQDFRNETINLHPSGVQDLCLGGIKLATMKVDFHHLEQLGMYFCTLSECLHVLGNAPRLTTCVLLWELDEEDHEFPLPPTPIVHPSIRQLHFSTPLCKKIFEHLLCPALKLLQIHGDGQLVETPSIIGFLKRSGCSLDSLIFYDAQLSVTEITSWIEAIPMLGYLEMKLNHSEPALRVLLEHLAEFSTVDGIQVPRYFPALHSLKIEHHPFDDWRVLPDIFGTTIANPKECHRRTLKSITISTSLAPPGATSSPGSDLVRGVDSETLARILWLKGEGVKWTISQAEI